MSDDNSVATLTVEILKQIRDGVYETKAEVTSLRNELKYELSELKGEITELRTDLKGEISELRTTVIRVARVNDETLKVSLDDSGRMDVLEGRLRTLEAEVAELRTRQ